MSIEYSFQCHLPNGMHARPASHIENICRKFICDITWINHRNNNYGDTKSVLSLISTNTLLSDPCTILFSGQDENVAHQKISYFIEHELEKCDSSLKQQYSNTKNKTTIPRTLSNTHPHCIHGTAVVQGIGTGRIQKIDGLSINMDILNSIQYDSYDLESKKFTISLQKNINTIQDKMFICSKTEKDILNFQISFLTDSDFISSVKNKIQCGCSCEVSIYDVINRYRLQFRNAESSYLKERELDIIDVSYLLLNAITPDLFSAKKTLLKEPTICIADNLTPSQFIEIDKKYLTGLILSHAGNTSHTVILARSFGIPTLIGVDCADIAFLDNQSAILDGYFGLLIHDADDQVSRYYQNEIRTLQHLAVTQETMSTFPGKTLDGRMVEIAANIASAPEANLAFTSGADAIGLFRTEMLYMDRVNAPSEEELYTAFVQVMKQAHGRPVIIRTMDIGGDKPSQFIKLSSEKNPFLGYRGIRIYKEFNTLFRDQLRAILRVTALGPVKIMVPMVCSYDEIIWVKSEIASVKLLLAQEGITVTNNYQLGIMIEVPSIMFIIDQCCDELDFFSIGSNDLTQYLMAADRDNQNVSEYYNCFNPAFIRGLKQIVDTVHKHHKWIGLCGEMGSQSKAIPILVGLGLDEISMSRISIARTKKELSQLDFDLCQQLVNRLCSCRTIADIDKEINNSEIKDQYSDIITADCISIACDYQNKEEAIKGMVDRLYLADRCKDRFKLIDELWTRENAYTTDIGFGFSIPHSKSEQITSNTISICTLKKPISWGSSDVSIIIMLTLKDKKSDIHDNEHMKIFSKLAKKIMNHEFRDQIYSAKSVEEMRVIFNENLA